MKISNFREKTTIRRATKNFDEFGNRIYQELEYNIKFDPKTEDHYVIRLFAKIIDIIPLFIIILLLTNFICPPFNYFISFIIVIIINATSECLTGQTLGKKIFKLKVIDDFGNYPNFPKSLLRNFLFFLNFQYDLFHYKKDQNDKNEDLKFSPDVNNRICKTYVIKEKTYQYIKTIIGEKNVT